MSERRIVPDDLKHWLDVPWDRRFELWAYPIAIISDRYGGAYSGGTWIAVAGMQNRKPGSAVLKMLSEHDEEPSNPWGDDIRAGDFWANPPSWIAAGDTPEDALNALKKKNANIDWPFDERS